MKGLESLSNLLSFIARLEVVRNGLELLVWSKFFSRSIIAVFLGCVSGGAVQRFLIFGVFFFLESCSKGTGLWIGEEFFARVYYCRPWKINLLGAWIWETKGLETALLEVWFCAWRQGGKELEVLLSVVRIKGGSCNLRFSSWCNPDIDNDDVRIASLSILMFLCCAHVNQ